MRLLLDTHALLWWLFDDPRLSRRARALIAAPDNSILVSSATAWEIATKHRLGKLASAKELVRDIEGWIDKAEMIELPVAIRHAQKAGTWSVDHRDPFDRMLAAQSQLDDIPLVTRDEVFEQFGIETRW